MSAQIIPTRTAAETALADAFGAAKAKLPGGAAAAKLREESFGDFFEAGLPHRRVESWHYTDLRTIMREALPIAPAPSEAAIAALRAELAASGPSQRLVLVDGYFVPELSDTLPAGVTVRSLASALSDSSTDLIALLSAQNHNVKDPILSLNAALMQDGVVIEVAPGAEIAEPIHLIHATAAGPSYARFQRSLVLVGAGASVTIAELNHGEGGRTGQTFGCLIFSVGAGARARHVAGVTGGKAGSLRLESFVAELGAKAKFDSFALITGAGLVRRQIFMRFAGEEAEAALSGVSLLCGRDHADTTLFVEHAAPGCVGRETFRYILDDEATGIFQGKIRVEPEAQKTDGKMLSRALLLSDGAAMNNKPELEIFADDVACGHGATCGGLNPDQLFYIQARGLPQAEAEALLLEAFAGELVDDIGHENLVVALRSDVASWLASRVKV